MCVSVCFSNQKSNSWWIYELEPILSGCINFLKNVCVAYCRKPVWKDGSTAVAILAINSTLYIANLGDSKVGTTITRQARRDLKQISVAINNNNSVRIYKVLCIRVIKPAEWH